MNYCNNYMLLSQGICHCLTKHVALVYDNDDIALLLNILQYTGWPTNFQDFALINSYIFFSPCWIEHLFLIIITPISSNLVENFLFYE